MAYYIADTISSCIKQKQQPPYLVPAPGDALHRTDQSAPYPSHRYTIYVQAYLHPIPVNLHLILYLINLFCIQPSLHLVNQLLYKQPQTKMVHRQQINNKYM